MRVGAAAITPGLRVGQVSTSLQSAAQLFALLYPDGGHSLVRLPDGRHWLVAALGGTVLSQTDRVFDSLDDAQHERRALLVLRPGLQEHAAEQVWAALLQAAEPGARLTALPSRWAELPLALRLFLACIILAAAAPPLWNSSVGSLFRQQAAKPEPAAIRDPLVDAYQAMLSSTAAHASTELVRLLAGVGRLPVQVRGWALRRAQCDAGAQQWICSAVYARAHPRATNHSLYALLPPGWQVSVQAARRGHAGMAHGVWRLAAGRSGAALRATRRHPGGGRLARSATGVRLGGAVAAHAIAAAPACTRFLRTPCRRNPREPTCPSSGAGP